LGTWNKNYWADCESLVFLKSNFYVGENFKFQCDPFSNKKDFWIFFNDIFGTSVDGHEKIIA
jgi:hypothetical protein